MRLALFDPDPNLTAPERRREAAKVALNILVILMGSALVGLQGLEHIWYYAGRIQGSRRDDHRLYGILICCVAAIPLLKHRPENGDAKVQGSLVPLLMFAAGPGTITAVVTLAAVHTPDSLPMTAIIATVVGAGVTFVTLILAVRLGPRLGHGTQATVTRFMELIVASMGMQFVLVGLKAFFEA